MLVSGILEHDSDPNYGQIIYIIDIPLPAVVSEPIITEVLETIRVEYFDIERKTPIYQFEDCIKQINASLAYIAEQGNSEWIGHIHSLIALLVGNEIYISHSGRATAAVVRGSLYTPIVSPSPNPNQRILAHKTYANMVSGQLSDDDLLIFGNSEIARHFSPQFLTQAAQNNATSAIQSMYQAGRRLNLKNIATIVAKVEPDDSNIPTNPYSITLDQPLESVAGTLIPKIGNTKSISSAIKKIPRFNAQRVFIDLFRTFKQVFINPKQDLEFQQDDNTLESKSYHHSAQTKLTRTPGQKFVNRVERMHGLCSKLLFNLQNIFKNLPPKYLISIGVIMLGILLLTIGQRITKHNINTPNSSEIATQTSKILELLDSANLTKVENPEKSRESLTEAKTQLNQLSSSSDPKVEDVRIKYLAMISEINNVTTIDDKIKLGVSKDTNNIFVIGQYLFTTKNNSSDIFRLTLGKNETEEKIFTTPDKNPVIKAVLNEPARQLTIITKANNLYVYSLDDQNSATLLSPPQGEKWPDIQSLTWYQKNLYILESRTGSILKYISTDGVKFTTKSPYLASEGFSNGDAKMITSDGSIYILFNSGLITKLIKGNKQGFGPLILPKPDNSWNNPNKMFTGTISGHLYVQDKVRVVETNQDGTYRSQYQFPYGDIEDCYISPITKRGWVLFKSEVYQFSL